MKKLKSIIVSIIGLAILSICSIGFWGCEKNEVIDIPNYEIYQEIGMEHNNGLDYVFDELKKANVSKTTLKSANLNNDIFEIAQKATEDFVKRTFEMSNENLSNANLQISKAFANTLKNGARLKSGKANLYDNEMAASLSDLQIDLLDELNKIMSDNDYNLNSLRNRIISIEKRAVSNLLEEEYAIILSAASVAKYTLEYWSENFDKWSELLGGNTVTLSSIARLKSSNVESDNGGFSWKEVGKVDVATAAGAATTGGVTYLLGLGPVGWKAWAGIVGGAAVGGSVTDIILQIW